MACTTCGKPKCVCTKIITKQGLGGKRGAPGKTVVGPVGPTGPTGPSNLTIANTVFVMKNGNNSTGLVERLDKPFLTIAGARAAATAAFVSRTDTARIRIVVESGYYQENIILDKFIDYDLGNCVINGGITDNNVDFGGTGIGVWTNVIYGAAKIYNQQSSGIVTALITYRPNTKLLVYCDTLASLNDDCVAIISGIVRIHCNRIYTESTSQDYMFAIEMAQGFESVDFNFSKLEVIGADIYNLATSVASTISFESGGTDKNQVLTLIDCRVKSQNEPVSGDNYRSAIACGSSIDSNGTLKMYDTVLYSAFGKSIYVNTGNTLTVYYYHSNMANKATGGAGTLTNALTTVLTVNAAVEAGF